ncbi:MAG: hypothetical protein K1X94_15280 [Sandaracinaceae bacterium]|nr:hypothetical protein [Sandaracinaceae bacterium]
MLERGHIAFDPNGRIFVLTHDEELLVHDGDSEAPLWRESLGEPLVGVAIAGDEIVAVTETGAVRRFTFLHRELPRASLGAPTSSFAVRGDGAVAAVHDDHVSILRRNDLAPVPLYHRGVSALAWSRDGTRLAIAKSVEDREHTVTLLEGQSFEPIGSPVTTLNRVLAMCASPKGFLVTSGDRLVKLVPGTGAVAHTLEHVTRAKDRVLRDVACSADGTRFALQLERSQVIVLGDPPDETLLDVKYPERVCAGVAFGSRSWIAIALGGGDANKVNVETGAMHRSDTHPGRTHNRWFVSVGGAFMNKAGASAAAPSTRSAVSASGAGPASGPASGAARAALDQSELERQRRARQALADAEQQLRQGQASDTDTRTMIRIGLIVLAVLLGIARACAHTHH